MKPFKGCPTCLLNGCDAMGNDCVTCGGSGIVEATTTEIMVAHPKCGECRHWEKYCINPNLPETLREVYYIEMGPYDYCNKWEAKQ